MFIFGLGSSTISGMAISKEEVLALAQLARLQLTDKEAEALGKDISSILKYVGQVSAVSGADTTVQKPLLRNVMREDIPYEAGSPTVGRQEALRAAFPKSEKGYNVVRKIISKD